MRRVISGKIYNTATAKLIHEWSNHYYRSDFHWCSEDLYRTRRGQYFIHGEGGPLSKYSTPVGNNAWGGGSALHPMSDEEALEWLERRGAPVSLIADLFPLEEA